MSGHQRRAQHKLPGQWYEHRGALRYCPMFPVIKDDETDYIGANCKYAGYMIEDTIQVRSIDVSASDRWKATPLPCLAGQAEHTARTRSLLWEELDRMYHANCRRPRQYVGTRLRHETEATA